MLFKMPRKASYAKSYRAPVKASYRKPVRMAPSKRAPRYSMGKSIGSSLGSMIGSAAAAALAPETEGLSLLAAPLAKKAGSSIGGWLGSTLQGVVSGHGDYKVSINSIVNPGSSVPIFRAARKRKGATIIRHREYFGDLVGGALSGGAGTASVFTSVTPLQINPANSLMFPWLSSIAACYEEWQPLGILFDYKSTSGNISTSTALGTVILATQYNSLNPGFLNKQAMENYEFAISTKPSRSCIHPVECDPRQTPSNGIFYVGNGNNNPGSGADSRLTNLGQLNIASVGLPTANQVCGELWVTYEIAFYKPRVPLNTTALSDRWVSTTGTGFAVGTNYFGTDTALSSGSDGFTTVSGTTIVFSQFVNGKFLILYNALQPAGVSTPMTWTASNGLISSGPNLSTSGQPTKSLPTQDATNSTQIVRVECFQCNNRNDGTLPTLTINGGTFGTPSGITVLIVQVLGNFS